MDLDLFLSEAILFVFSLIGDRSLFLAFDFGVGDLFRLVDRDLLLLTGLLVLDLFLIGLLVLRRLIGVLDLRPLLTGDLLLDLDLDLLTDRLLDLERFRDRDFDRLLERDLDLLLERDFDLFLERDLERLLDRESDRFLDLDLDFLFDLDRLLDLDLECFPEADLERFLDLDLDFDSFFSAFTSEAGSTLSLSSVVLSAAASVSLVVGVVAALVLSITLLWSAATFSSDFFSVVATDDSSPPSPTYSEVKISSWSGNSEART